tara:strand:- start:20406 stop:21224 length:819 start_codon:yes stop_codon:yes gene_type:complete
MTHFFKFLFSKTFLINLIIALLLISLGLFGTMQYLENYTLHGKKIEIPDLVGQHMNDFDTLLVDNNRFAIAVNDSIYVKGKTAGLILEQNPIAGTTVKQGRKIYLTIAAAEPSKVTMPDLVDMSLRQATTLLQTYGLAVGELEYIADLCVNCILEQKLDGVDLMKGTKVPAGSEIDLVVGRGLGDELVSVPFLIGMNVEFSRVLLVSKSLNLGTLIYDETVMTENDTVSAKVYRQIPSYQEEPNVRMGSSVDLFLTADSTRIDYSGLPSDTL